MKDYLLFWKNVKQVCQLPEKFEKIFNNSACKDGVSSLEKDVEDCLLFAQFLVNNTIAVQE